MFTVNPAQFSPVMSSQSTNPRLPSPSSMSNQSQGLNDLRSALTQPNKINREQHYRQFKVKIFFIILIIYLIRP